MPNLCSSHNGRCCSILIVLIQNYFLSTEASSETENGDEPLDPEEIEILFVREPTKEQAELASKLMLPLTFFCYKNEPGYFSDDTEDGMEHILCVMCFHLNTFVYYPNA